MQSANEYDVIVIGSGTCGATLARELSKQNKKVLLLERGKSEPLRESLGGFAAIAKQVAVGKNLKSVKAITTGGSSGMYFGVVNYPPLDAFAALGLDIAADLEEVKRELPIAPLADALLGEQALKLRDSAQAIGLNWHKHDMLIDQSKCSNGGYTHGALWRARSFVEEAVRNGVTLIEQATVNKVIIDKGQAIGVEYVLKKGMFSFEQCKVYGAKIVLAAGELVTPHILRASGVQGIGTRGFYCSPGYALYGLVPGLQGKENFVGSMGCVYQEGIELGDANVSRFLHRMLMLGKFKLKHMRSYPQTMGVGVKVKDGLGGEMRANGSFFKEFTPDTFAKLKKGEEEAIRLLKHAGATHIFNCGLQVGGRVGGMVTLHEHFDTHFETQFRNLYVCDGSMMPNEMRGTPTVTLVALAKYLARHLSATN